MKGFLTLFSFFKEKRFNRLSLVILLQVMLCIIPSVDLKAVSLLNTQQQIAITGTIKDETGAVMTGVNVVEKGTTNGVVTTVDGSYSILLKSAGSVLVYSYVGYLTEEVIVGSQTVIDMTMAPDVQSLGEVVVVGYGSMERSNVTGSITSLKAEDINKVPVPNVVEALRGQVPGVRITRTSGQPGSGVDFLIRGKKSIGEDDDDINENEPLIVIDGVPTTGGNIDEINPADIASIDILKDAAAASIYGTSGANGVILITTKNGFQGKPSISVNASYGVTELTQLPTMFNAKEYVQLKMDAAEGAGRPNTLADVLTDPVELANWNAGNEINWHDKVLRQGNVRNAGVSMSGGTDKFTYYMNGDAYLEKGIVPQTDYNRYSLRCNSEYSPYKFLKTGVKVQLSKSNADETGNSAVLYQDNPDFTDFIGNSPLGRIYDSTGALVRTVKGDQFQNNPYYMYKESMADRKISRNYINPYVEFAIIKGLTYRINGFIEQRIEKSRRFTTDKYNDGAYSTMKFENVEANTYLLDNIVNYKKSFLDKHSLDATFVYGFQTFNSSTLKADDQYDQGELLDMLGYYSFPSLATTTTPLEWGKVYYVGRLGYSYDSRYNLTLTMRRDGSSKFGENNKFGNFPSASFAWNASNESFLQDNKIISLLKYRISYGVMGNDRIADYGYISLTGNSMYSFNGKGYSGKTTGNFGNESIKWEESRQFNTGFDFGLLTNRISGSFDYYKTRTTDLLLPEIIPITTGFRTTISNVGETKNWGIEANVKAKVLDGDFKWEISVNWAKDKNEIVSLNRSSVDAEGNPISDIANGWFIGEDIDVIYDYDFIGIYQTGEEAIATSMHPDRSGYGPGDPKIRDVNGDGVITSADKTFVGSPTPEWYGGLQNSFSYKNFEFSILFESVQGVEKCNGFYGNLVSRDNQVKVDYWTPRNPSNEFPQPNVSQTYAYETAVKMRDASFIALRNISLQYTLPREFLKKTPVQSISVYIRGNNLKYFTDYKDSYSPESTYGSFPTVKTWSFGTNINF